jgi:hypothetical protein
VRWYRAIGNCLSMIELDPVAAAKRCYRDGDRLDIME